MSEFVPAFVKAQVYKGGPADAPETEAAREPVRVWHLLSHTSGLMRLETIPVRLSSFAGVDLTKIMQVAI